VLWPVPPTWVSAVRERLAWQTSVVRSRYSGRAQKRALRRAPRRYFELTCTAQHASRRALDTLLQARGVEPWQLPIYHDVQFVAPLTSGASAIPCTTAGYEFAAGGEALLWRGLNDWEIVAINTVGGSQLSLSAPTTRAWPVATRLYPLRAAVLEELPAESSYSDARGTRQVQFRLLDAEDATATAPAASYLGYPVLEEPPEWSADLETLFNRDIERVDNDTGAVTLTDQPGRAFREGQCRWLLGNRARYSQIRALLYWLRGQYATLWVPTWHSDLQLAADIGASDPSITVEWAGHSLFGALAANWRDIRIELLDGTIYYRRLTSVAEQGATEALGIDVSLGVAVSRAQVRRISFLVLSEQAGDALELEHATDASGITRVSTRFRGVWHDL
jgi:hypothetical protein